MNAIASNKFTTGKKFHLGSFSLSEEEIISFAKQFDPLPFHTDIELAKESIFKGLVASGPHLFYKVYLKEFLPRFGKTILCGVGVTNWKFIKPVYANQKVSAELTVLAMTPDEKTGSTIVSWYFEFKNEQKETIQIMQMEVMHRLSR